MFCEESIKRRGFYLKAKMVWEIRVSEIGCCATGVDSEVRSHGQDSSVLSDGLIENFNILNFVGLKIEQEMLVVVRNRLIGVDSDERVLFGKVYRNHTNMPTQIQNNVARLEAHVMEGIDVV